MGVSNIIKNIKSTEWAITDDFMFTFNNPAVPLSLDTGVSPQDIWDMCVINIDTPQISADVSSSILGGTYKLYTRRFNLYTLSTTFRDVAGMGLKSYFTQILFKQQSMYFDEIKSSINVSINGQIVYASNDVLITDVSQSQFDNNNNQIAEFTVTFTAPYFSNKDITDYGAPGKLILQ